LIRGLEIVRSIRAGFREPSRDASGALSGRTFAQTGTLHGEPAADHPRRRAEEIADRIGDYILEGLP
jgi:hypothetical protein